ncbi:hypothetical protein B0H15DRAFT_1024206 [Mycena belliarum]|uniref:non-specific serine/threonine protein kinase n=1 Tax=Mycena belliarum TaxID=1033014 RepID=A0AAD6TXZ8_9AGAR|nr:hypothetical protein B0H15DRAFT_1024206 [Mycena belliae]
MAQQPYQAYSQNKGTLVPGQSISVNKYTVQVERYLSQGGFAHVYLVRTATPVYNTTHHVLKRIAVANDSMLTEVKKEVDIMRLLKGHPNIVHLIDAAWHRMPNGLYEVFILMEFCSGGGIIDMMNRRLRERLTEAEILQIFVDVCEGVAYMHNSRPALLHRDLKVENILQASATSFKLCDFGSATTVSPRAPATAQEIRALEADLNRHTTLQYRAPEMVDPYLRRAVDEKSDVWALGVLLYKLCYYTTPFEEHGPLAILNVQYRIPPYPVYSTQLNGLIASMLREHGAQRPSVFELLSLVHRLRGTKSQFTYQIPAPQPLSPRPQQTQFAPLEGYPQQQQQPTPSKSAGVQARDKVLEAIAPMRRGRPAADSPSPAPSRSRGASPQKEKAPPPREKNWLEEEERAWQAATVKSGTSAPGARTLDDAWMTRGGSGGASAGAGKGAGKGFGDDFAEKLWDSFDPGAKGTATSAKAAPASTAASPPLRPPAFTGSYVTQPQRPGMSKDKDKDAFAGLGGLGGGTRAAPTLGEARMLRTGLAGTSSSQGSKYDGASGDYTSYKPSRPSPSPRPSQPSYLTQPAAGQSPGQSLSPNPPALKPADSGSSWLSQAPSSMSRPSSRPGDGNDGVETRFPSLEELDKTFDSGPRNGYAGHASQSQPVLAPRKDGGPPSGDAPRHVQPTAYGHDGVRSQQTTGVAMRDAGSSGRAANTPSSPVAQSVRPTLTRKHRSSLVVKNNYTSSNDDSPAPPGPGPALARMGAASSSGALPSGTPAPSQKPRDWLTDTDDEASTAVPVSHTRTATMPASTRPPGDYSSRPLGGEYARQGDYSAPVLRQSPSKRASYIEKSGLHIQEPVLVQRETAPPPSSQRVPPSPTTPSSPTTRAARVFPAIDLSAEPSEQEWASGRQTQKDSESASSADEGPEDANGFMGTPVAKVHAAQGAGRAKHKGRQSSVHDLVDLYGGSGFALPPKEKDRVSPSLLEDTTPKKAKFSSGPTDTKAKRRSAGLASVSTAHAASSNSALSPPNSGRQPSASSPRSAKSSTPVSPRSRPQSMFVFPSKPAEPPAPSMLSPPEAPRARTHTRRTSISDMVQRYEAIGGKSPVSSTAPSPVPPPITPSKTLPPASAAPRAENGRFSSVSSQSTSSSSSGINGRSVGAVSLPGLSDPSKSAGTGALSRVSPTGPPRTATPRRVSPTGLPRTSTPQREAAEPVAPRARRPSFKAVDIGAAARPPSRKATAEEPSPTPTSPERPYQGVGKLIDQWQRKTAETDGARPPVAAKRGLVAKRATGLVGKGT